MYLIGTVVLSELRKRERHAGIVRWLHDKAVDALFLSAITIGEIERGVLRQQVKNPVFAEALRAWLDRTVETYRDRTGEWADRCDTQCTTLPADRRSGRGPVSGSGVTCRQEIRGKHISMCATPKSSKGAPVRSNPKLR